MKRWVAGAAVVVMLVAPGILVPRDAAAGSSNDAALALGAFAVFNQMISGTGVFGGNRTVVVERPVVYTSPPPVVYAPPPPPVVYAPPPPAVVYPAPPPAFVYAPPPRPVAVYPAPAPVVVYPKRVYAAPAWCPPGLAKQGRCYEHGYRGPRH